MPLKKGKAEKTTNEKIKSLETSINWAFGLLILATLLAIFHTIFWIPLIISLFGKLISGGMQLNLIDEERSCL